MPDQDPTTPTPQEVRAGGPKRYDFRPTDDGIEHTPGKDCICGPTVMRDVIDGEPCTVVRHHALVHGPRPCHPDCAKEPHHAGPCYGYGPRGDYLLPEEPRR